jgi:outer membrane protein OmpA-like peptidoglycan-associated protein
MSSTTPSTSRTVPPPPVPAAPALIAPPTGAVEDVAALPKVTLPRDGGLVTRIDFVGGSTRLTRDAERQLMALSREIADGADRLQLKSYAGGTGETLSASRRLSLSRALAVRSYLIEAGIRSTRIDVRALGRSEDSGPQDRVDVVLLTQ